MTHDITKTQRTIIGCLLMAWMIITRGFHFIDGTVIIMMLVGIFLHSPYMFWVFMVAAMMIDVIVIGSQFGLDALKEYCIGSAAYYYLIFAFGVMWWVGRIYRFHFYGRYLPLVILALLGTFGYEMISAGSYYVFGGDFENPNWSDWFEHEPKYLYAQLQRTFLYLIPLIVANVLFVKYKNK